MFKFFLKKKAVPPALAPLSTVGSVPSVEPMPAIEDRATAAEAARRTTQLLLAQLGLAATLASAVRDDAWCLGYLYGSYDEAFRRAGADDVSSMVELTSGFTELLEARAGQEAVRRCLNLRNLNDGTFREGEAVGRTEMNAFLDARSVLAPMSLFTRLQAKPLRDGRL